MIYPVISVTLWSYDNVGQAGTPRLKVGKTGSDLLLGKKTISFFIAFLSRDPGRWDPRGSDACIQSQDW